jgi:hypothetical protein
MNPETAIDIVLELAEANIIEDPELEEYKIKQIKALKIVEKMLRALHGGTMALFGSKKDEGCYTPNPLLKQLKENAQDLRVIQENIQNSATKIGRAYSKKHNLDCDIFLFVGSWKGNMDLYKTGKRIDDTWKLVKTIRVPDWAFDDPEKYIKEDL